MNRQSYRTIEELEEKTGCASYYLESMEKKGEMPEPLGNKEPKWYPVKIVKEALRKQFRRNDAPLVMNLPYIGITAHDMITRIYHRRKSEYWKGLKHIDWETKMPSVRMKNKKEEMTKEKFRDLIQRQWGMTKEEFKEFSQNTYNRIKKKNKELDKFKREIEVLEEEKRVDGATLWLRIIEWVNIQNGNSRYFNPYKSSYPRYRKLNLNEILPEEAFLFHDMLATVDFLNPYMIPRPRGFRSYLPYTTPAVYFLYENGKMVYVGCTSQPRDRLRRHTDTIKRKKGLKSLRDFTFNYLGVDDAFTVEKLCIKEFDPKYNQTAFFN